MATLTTTAAALAIAAPAEDTLSLTELAAGINARLAEADAAESTASDARIAAGRMLMAAKRKVPNGYWTRWLAKHVQRSRADVYRCMALVNSEIAAEQAAEAEELADGWFPADSEIRAMMDRVATLSARLEKETLA